MKYIVVEIHTGYAVLMDENALFVRSANLGYEVGQTVENPILEEIPEKQRKNIIIYRVLASAAACFALVTGFFVYQRNYAVYSTITISASADEIYLQVNRKGEVLTAESINSDTQLLENYDPHGKDKITAAEEIVQKAISMGCINDGDTVSFYIDTPENDYTKYKTEIEEHFRSDKKIKVDVQKGKRSEKDEKPERKEKITPTKEIVTTQAQQPAIYQEIIPSENTNQENSAVIEDVPKEPETELNENFSDSNKNSIENNENFSDSDKNKIENNENFSNSDRNRVEDNEDFHNYSENNYDNNFSEFKGERNENSVNVPDYSQNNYDNNENQQSWERNDEYTQRDNNRNSDNNHGRFR